VKIAIGLESTIGDFNLLRYIHRSVILITSHMVSKVPLYTIQTVEACGPTHLMPSLHHASFIGLVKLTGAGIEAALIKARRPVAPVDKRMH